MMNAQVNRTSIIVACGAAVILTIAFWIKNRKNETTRIAGECETDKLLMNDKCGATVKGNSIKEVTIEKVKEDPMKSIIPKEWEKVGRIKDLFIYPLKSGRGRDLKESVFTDYGISVESNNFLLRDRMLLVYKEKTGEFKTGRNYPTLVLVTLNAISEGQVKLEAVGMPGLTFRVPDMSGNNLVRVPCYMWWGEALECIDCGPEAAKWISRFLTGTNTGLRLGYALEKRRNIMEGPWEKFTKVYDTLRNEDTGLYSDLASYMLMTEASVQELNQKLDRPVPALQFRPNIVVAGPEPFAEDKWEWIKIGKSVVIRNVKPCPRCSMIYIDPDTGVKDRHEPMKTLRQFREQSDPKRVQVDGKAPTMGIYCGLYQTGEVKIGDEVYVHKPKESSEASKEQGADLQQNEEQYVS